MNKQRTLEIEQVVTPVYRIRYGKGSTRRYHTAHTLEAALKKTAWWIVWDKYGTWSDSYAVNKPRHLPPCDCYCDPGSNLPNAYECGLHNRDDGYFRRLHTRLVRWLEKSYVLPGSIIGENGSVTT